MEPNSVTANSDMPDKGILIHAGYHKTGTTFLQQNLFADQKAGYCSPVDRNELRNMIIRTNPFIFDPAAVRKKCMPSVTEAIQKGTVPVLSHEQFTGQPAGSGYGIRRRQREISRKEVANRLQACFPEAKVFIVIREQKEMIKSIYKYFVSGWHGKLSASIDQFLDQKMLEDGYGPLFHLDYLLFHHVIEHYQSLFGRDSVLILPYEWLRDQPIEFVNRINSFTGNNSSVSIENKKVNQSNPASLCSVQRHINRLLASPDKPGYYSKPEKKVSDFLVKMNRYVPEKIHIKYERKLTEKISQLTEGVFSDSNRKTEKLTGLDVSALGYE